MLVRTTGEGHIIMRRNKSLQWETKESTKRGEINEPQWGKEKSPQWWKEKSL